MSKELDAIFFRNFTLILIALAVFGVFAAIMGRYIATLVPEAGVADTIIADRVAPVGEVYTEDNPPPAAATAVAASSAAAGGADKGKQVYDSVCMACHATGVAGAPKLGDKDAWAGRIVQGVEILHEHAIKGFQGAAGLMPPRGGRADLPDEDVKAAVDYILANSGGLAAPASAVPSTAAAEAPAGTATASAEAAPLAASEAVPPSAATSGAGKQVYESACFVCHAQGVAGAPKFADKDAWRPRIAQGADTLYEHAVKGFMGKGLMPPKGGRPDLADEDVKAAVDYMVDAAK
ncbi:MAG: c-type cytochrome [Chromatiales bacterium]